MRLAFIGFGEAGRAFATSLADAGAAIAAYDVLLGTPEGAGIAAAAARIGVRTGSPAEVIAGADIVISAVTAGESLRAIEAVAAHLEQGQYLFDINSVSPDRKAETARLVTPKGVAYVDMAVMAPAHPRLHHTPVLIAGDPAVTALLDRLDFNYEVIGPTPGQATAIKMIRSLFVKGIEALTVQALDAATRAGCRDRILASLSATYAGLGWPEFADYQAERVATHGRRRAAEMRECAATLAELGLPEGAALAAAIADVQDRFARAPDRKAAE
jgi:3-hydroxyisobutyrate dehydrogenase-like beta-hydroxyacid dehydrogenase